MPPSYSPLIFYTFQSNVSPKKSCKISFILTGKLAGCPAGRKTDPVIILAFSGISALCLPADRQGRGASLSIQNLRFPIMAVHNDLQILLKFHPPEVFLIASPFGSIPPSSSIRILLDFSIWFDRLPSPPLTGKCPASSVL